MMKAPYTFLKCPKVDFSYGTPIVGSIYIKHMLQLDANEEFDGINSKERGDGVMQ